jgi:regulator of cell morphogenesis and NO signaling
MATAAQSIREIVATQASAAAILERFQIDLCAHANDSLGSACSRIQLSTEQVLEKLEEGARADAGSEAIDPVALSPSRLIQHIVRTHHRYIRRELPRLNPLARKLADRRAITAPEFKRIAALVEELQTGLLAHLEKEELILFPFIAQLGQEPLSACAAQACFHSVRQPITLMIREHDSAATTLEEIRLLTGDFTPPEWACLTQVALYSGLRAFAADLSRHVELEDNVLFPRAIAMEAELLSRR